MPIAIAVLDLIWPRCTRRTMRRCSERIGYGHFAWACYLTAARSLIGMTVVLPDAPPPTRWQVDVISSATVRDRRVLPVRR